MKKTILCLMVLALMVPAAAFAQTEFTLGGWVKLDSYWDSTQEGKNNNTPIARNNDPNFQHGRVKFTAQGSRFNFTIKGPTLWGAKTTGFMEIDFDPNENATLGAPNASNGFVPRLRHAMFRLNWPETELLMGQYWSMFCEYYAETAQDGAFQGHGTPTARLAQIRLTQKFAGDWTASALIGEPNAGGTNLNAYSVNTNGESAETPQVQGKLMYQHDWWGQAAFYGRPMPFTAQIVGGWQRESDRPNLAAFGFNSFGQNTFVLDTGFQKNHQYLNPYMIQGTLFIPVLPTYSKNLGGTASLSGQLYVGQGLSAFGESFAGGENFFTLNTVGRFAGGTAAVPFFDQQLEQRYGGYVQGQYYFSNEWFLNVAYGFSKAFHLANDRHLTQANGYNVAFPNVDPYNMWQEIDACLWYRPITALKFGLQYAYSRTDWLQRLGSPQFAPVFGTTGINTSSVGEAHRIEFVGFFYF